MQVAKNMLTSHSIKGPYMKPFFVLLPFVVVGCGSETPSDAPSTSMSKEAVVSPVKTAEPDPGPDAANTPSTSQEDAVAAIKNLSPEPDAPNASLTAQADAVAAIKKLGGIVKLDEISGEVIRVSLINSRITDAGLVHLKALTSLKRFWLYGPQITDAGLEHLKGLTNLKRFLHCNTQITDAGLEHLKGLAKLTTLRHVTQVDLMFLSWICYGEYSGKSVDPQVMGTDATLELLSFFPPSILAKLTSLRLTGPQITDAGLEHLKGLTGLTNLTTLYLNNMQITDAGLEHLKGLTTLETLFLNNTHITDAGLVHLKGMTRLKLFMLNDTQVTDAGLSKLKAALPSCDVWVNRARSE